MSFSIKSLASDIISGLGDFFGIGTQYRKLIGDDKNKEELNKYIAELQMKLDQVKANDQSKYNAIIEGINTIKRSGALRGSDLTKAIREAQTKANKVLKGSGISQRIETAIATAQDDKYEAPSARAKYSRDPYDAKLNKGEVREATQFRSNKDKLMKEIEKEL